MEIQNRALFENLVSEATGQEFSGWDFRYIRDRWKESPLSWNYPQLVRNFIQPEISLLDMDTGGGELLSSLQPLPRVTYATEAYSPNVIVARNRLEPLGVNVVQLGEDKSLHFADCFFDLVINRHGSYSASDIHRILKPGGTFITQQVGGENNFELNKMLQEYPQFEYSYWTLMLAVDQLEESGLQILEQKEEFPETIITDIGALVFHLKVVSWQIADFSVEKYYEKLAAIHNLIQEKGSFRIRSHRFLIVAKKESL
jgi:SAM-dependent methyltransferase